MRIVAWSTHYVILVLKLPWRCPKSIDYIWICQLRKGTHFPWELKTLTLKRFILLFSIVTNNFRPWSSPNHLSQLALHTPHSALPLKSILCATIRDTLQVTLWSYSFSQFTEWILGLISLSCYTHLMNPITILAAEIKPQSCSILLVLETVFQMLSI